jgi:hypothetical protein
MKRLLAATLALTVLAAAGLTASFSPALAQTKGNASKCDKIKDAQKKEACMKKELKKQGKPY